MIGCIVWIFLSGQYTCEEGWHQYRDQCYLISDNKTGHIRASAVKQCEDKGAFLLSINSEEENDAIKGFIG